MDRGGGLEKRVPTRLSVAEGRKFAYTVGIAFSVLAGVVWWRDHLPVASVLGALGVVLLVAGTAVPGRLTPIHSAWMAFGLFLSRFTTPVFMGLTYYLVLTPTGLLMRLFGKNPLVREPENGSYWVARPREKRQSNLERMF